MPPIRFAIVGAGWRSEFFIRIAKALPERFEVSAVLVRDASKADAFSKRLGVPTTQSLDRIISDKSNSFVVLSVPTLAYTSLISELADNRVPVLCETPAARDVNDMEQIYGWIKSKNLRLQIAEQYHLRPMHAARISTVESGLIGAVSQVQISVAHGCHGMSLMRKYLGIGFEEASISARRFESEIVGGPGRKGPPVTQTMEKTTKEIAQLDFGSKLGLFDFSGAQYFSYIRGTRVLIQGTQGEICNDEIRYLKDYRTPISAKFTRHAAGENDNLEGCYFKGIQMGENWVYKNPFIPAALSDDEIAIASCMEKMNIYVQGGPDVYSYANACQDHYLGLLISEAATTGE